MDCGKEMMIFGDKETPYDSVNRRKGDLTFKRIKSK